MASADKSSQLAEFRRLQADLYKLRQEWSDSPRATGGIMALRGFHYQMLTALKGLLSAWIESPEERQNDPDLVPLLVEALSDYSELTTTGVIVCQVKLAQSSGAVRGALNEFWGIDQLARGHTPNLVASLRYRILSRRPDLKNVNRTIGNWKPESDGAEADRLSGFKRRVEATLEPDPEIEILRLLANEFRAENPLDLVKRWLGKLLSGAENDDGFDRDLRVIWSDLCTLKITQEERQPRGYLWGESDRPPEEVEQGEVLTGQRAMAAHLREGYFADRPEIYNVITEKAEKWILEHFAWDPAGKIPCFWIGGRSGTGKSVALLHLLARLHERGHELIIWAEDQSSALPGIVRWCRPLLKKGYEVLIAVDDPFDPVRESVAESEFRKTHGELIDLRNSEKAPPPLILCCGPTEQQRGFEWDLVELVDVESANVPHETEQEREELRRWYVRRSGGEQPPEYESGADVLLVQLFFEWRTGQRLSEFARRFRQRIQHLEAETDGTLEDFINRLLALNRLYVGYAAGAVEELKQETPSFADALTQLSSEEQHLTLQPGEGHYGWRLAHPHLANAIYEEWFGPQSEHRLAHLRQGILDAIEFGKEPSERTAPLWAIARLGSPSTSWDVRNRLSPQAITDVLSTVYRKLLDSFKNELPTWCLPVWIEIEARFSDLDLAPSPVQEAIRRLEPTNVNDPGLRLICHKLLQHLSELPDSDSEEAAKAVRSLLVRCPDWHEWPHVALDYSRRTHRTDLLSETVQWVDQHPRRASTLPLLGVMLAISDDNKVLECGLQWLAAADVIHQNWGHVWQDLHRVWPTSGKLLEHGRAWLGSAAPEHPSWTHVWERLYRASPGDGTLVELGRPWLDDVDPENPSWTHVWEALYRVEPTEDLVDRALIWLEKNPDHLAWSRVWGPLFEAATEDAEQEDAELVDLGIGWLEEEQGGPAHSGWSYVWTQLFQAYPTHPDIVPKWTRWLDDARPDHESWPRVWGTLWHLASSDELFEQACAWLKANASHSKWTRVWRRLWDERPDDPELKRSGRNWLDTIELDHPGWNWVWGALLAVDPENEQLLQWGLEWLADARPGTKAWSYVWRRLYDAVPEHEELIPRWTAWLDDNPYNDAWGVVWRVLWNARGSDRAIDDNNGPGDSRAESVADREESQDPALSARARQWLREVFPDHRSWGGVWLTLLGGWRKLSETGPDGELAGDVLVEKRPVTVEEEQKFMDLGRRWLEDVNPDHNSWGRVWRVLWEEEAEDALFELARQWLERKEVYPEHRSWGGVWRVLLNAPSAEAGEPGLLKLGRRWLEDVNPNHNSWGRIWKTLLAKQPDDADLPKLGRRWLLDRRFEQADWPGVWKALFAARREDGELRGLGLEWLDHAAPDEGAWAFVWRELQESQPTDQAILERGKEWLKNKDAWSHESWGQVWKSVYRSTKEELEKLGQDWLESVSDEHPTRRLVEGALAEPGPIEEDIERLRQPLADDTGAYKAWGADWEAVWKKKPQDPRLIRLAKQRLNEWPGEDPSWTYVWSKLFEATPGDSEVLGLALDWLANRAPRDRGAWSFVWRKLWDHGYRRDKLATLGASWLDQQPNHKYWKDVQSRLGGAGPPTERR